MEKNVVIAGYARSPFHFAGKGELQTIRPDDLAAQVIADLVKKSEIDPSEIEDLILGCAFPEGEQGFNIEKPYYGRSGNYEILEPIQSLLLGEIVDNRLLIVFTSIRNKQNGKFNMPVSKLQKLANDFVIKNKFKNLKNPTYSGYYNNP